MPWSRGNRSRRARTGRPLAPVAFVLGAILAMVASSLRAAEPTADGIPFPEFLSFGPLDFEGITTTPDSDRRLPSGHGGLIWANIGIVDASSTSTTPSGYLNLANSPAGSGTQVAYTGGGEPAAILAPGDQYFGIRSIGLAAAWNDQLSVRLSGWRDGFLVPAFDQTILVDTDAPQTVVLDYHAIDELRIETSGGTPAAGLPESGTQLAIDNLVGLPTPVAGPYRNPANGHDYYLLSPGDWQRAEDSSQRLGGHLVTVDDQAELDWLAATFPGGGGSDPLWIGLNDHAVEGSFEWADGGSSSIAPWPWASGEPELPPAGDDQDGVTLDPSGTWSDRPSDASHGAILEVVPPQVISGPIRRPETGIDYYLVSAQTWDIHADFARSRLGGRLATLDDITEQQWVVDTFGGFGGEIWLGLEDESVEDQFLSQDGVPLGAFSNWLGHGDDQLVADWGLDETSGTTAGETVNGHHGTLSGATAWNPSGKVGGALDFTAPDSRVALPSIDIPGAEITLSAWVRPSSFAGTASEGRFISKATGSAETDHYWMLGLDGTRPRFRLKTEVKNETLSGPEGLLAIDQWNHVAGTYDGTRMRLYVDGVEVASVPMVGELPSAPTVDVALGNQPAGLDDRPFLGRLDEAMILDRALAANEVAGLAAGNGSTSVENPGNPGNQTAPPATDPTLNHALFDPSGTWDLASDPGIHRMALVEVVPGAEEVFAFPRDSPSGHASPSGHFGTTLAAEGTWLAVGAPGEDGDKGQVHLFDFAGPTPGVPVHTFTNPDPTNLSGFGAAVDIDNGRLAISALPSATSTTGGAVHVHDLIDPAYALIASFTDPTPVAGHQFGAAIDLSGDRLAVGGWRENTAGSDPGSARIFDLAAPGAAAIVLTPPVTETDNRFGSAIALVGDRVLVGAPGEGSMEGSVPAYDLSGASAGDSVAISAILTSPTPSVGDFFGREITADQGWAVVSAPGDSHDAAGAGAAFAYDLNEGLVSFPDVILRNPTPAAGDAFGSRVALLAGRALVGTPMDDGAAENAGTAYLFDLDSAEPAASTARFIESVPAAERQLGSAVALTKSRVILAADPAGEGTVLVFGPSPEIRVVDADSLEIVDGGSVDLHQVALESTYTLLLYVENTGAGLMEGVRASLSGTDADEFSLVELPSEEIGAGFSSAVTLLLDPDSSGPKSATLHLTSTDDDERPYDIAITAEVLSALQLYQNWAADHGLTGADADPEAIVFADGLTNLFKYALNLDGSKADSHPLVPNAGSSGIPILFRRPYDPSIVRFQFVRRRGSGLIYTPMYSSSLDAESFTAGGGITYIDPIDDQWERIAVDNPFDLDVEPFGFAILEVTLPPSAP